MVRATSSGRNLSTSALQRPSQTERVSGAVGKGENEGAIEIDVGAVDDAK
jgi:hypothetical protein